MNSIILLMYTGFNLLLIILLSTAHTTISTCPSLSCTKSAPIVRFPFQLPSPYQPSKGYPGYNLSCNTQALTVLTLPNSADFYVNHIDYYHQQITVSDPQNCILNRLMNLNLSDSPFHINYPYYRNYTFLSCPAHLVPSHYTTIECLSNTTSSVLATTSLSLANSLSESCTIIKTVPIPMSQSNNDQNGVPYDLITQGLRLSWNITGCIYCEGAGGFCGLNDQKELICYRNCQSGAGPSPREIRLFKLVIICFTIPAIAFTVGVALYFWYLDHGRRALGWAQDAHVMVYPATTITSSNNNGLDELTIESYAKMEVGESKRIPGPNGIACPICLTEYCPKDTLRSIPECRHCFHADCVDEWLRANPTCPLCRNSPSHLLSQGFD